MKRKVQEKPDKPKRPPTKPAQHPTLEQEIQLDADRWTGFRDSFGEREIGIDADGSPIELLRLVRELTAVEPAIADRVAKLAKIDRPGVARPVRLEQDDQKRRPRLVLVSERVVGVRLSEALSRGISRAIVPDIGAALFVMRRLFATAESLRASTGVSHFIIAPERVILTPRADVVITEAALAGGTEGLTTFPKALRLALADTDAQAESHRVDIARIARVGISMMLGRAVEADETVDALSPALTEISDVASIRAGEAFAKTFCAWLERAVTVDTDVSFADFRQAGAALDRTNPPKDCAASRLTLRTFLDDLAIDDLQSSEAAALESDRIRTIRARQTASRRAAPLRNVWDELAPELGLSRKDEVLQESLAEIDAPPYEDSARAARAADFERREAAAEIDISESVDAIAEEAGVIDMTSVAADIADEPVVFDIEAPSARFPAGSASSISSATPTVHSRPADPPGRPSPQAAAAGAEGGPMKDSVLRAVASRFGFLLRDEPGQAPSAEPAGQGFTGEAPPPIAADAEPVRSAHAFEIPAAVKPRVLDSPVIDPSVFEPGGFAEPAAQPEFEERAPFFPDATGVAPVSDGQAFDVNAMPGASIPPGETAEPTLPKRQKRSWFRAVAKQFGIGEPATTPEETAVDEPFADALAVRAAAEEAQRAAEARRGAEEAEADQIAEEAQSIVARLEARRAAEAQSERLAEEEARLAAKAEARRAADEEARRLAEAEARRLAEEQARADARRLAAENEARQWAAELEARRQAAEAEARRVAEEETRRLAAEAEARRRVEEEARRLAAEAEARRKAEEEARRLAAEAEARRRADEEARRLAAEAEARRKAEENARRLAAEAEAHRRADEEARRLAAEAEARRKAEENARRLAAEAEARRIAAEEEARRRADEHARRLAVEAEARKRAEEDARRAAEARRVAAIEAEAQRRAQEDAERLAAEEAARLAAEEAEFEDAEEEPVEPASRASWLNSVAAEMGLKSDRERAEDPSAWQNPPAPANAPLSPSPWQSPTPANAPQPGSAWHTLPPTTSPSTVSSTPQPSAWQAAAAPVQTRQPLQTLSASSQPASVRPAEPARVSEPVAAWEEPETAGRGVKGQSRNPQMASASQWMRSAALLIVAAGVVGGLSWAGYLDHANELLPGIVIIESNPTGAEIMVDGAARGVTPLTIELPPGQHRLELRRRGNSREITLEVAAGERLTQQIDLTNLRALGTLVVNSSPKGARVIVDGRDRGVTPLTLTDLAVGAHGVTIESKAGSIQKNVQIEAGARVTIDEGIFSGWIAVFAPFELQIFEKKRLIGTTDNERIMLPAGRHELEFVNAVRGFRDVRTVEVGPGATVAVNIQEAETEGLVRVEAPAGAEVFIDGNRVGESPLAEQRVPVGSREIVVKHPQMGEKKVTAVVTSDAPVEVKIEFEPQP